MGGLCEQGLPLWEDGGSRVRLPAAPVEDPADIVIVGMVFHNAPFKLGPRLRVVRHAAFLQRLECSHQTGKVKGEYNFRRKVKVRLAGFLAPKVRSNGLGGAP
eukprot:6305928-Amphidinium_carterae.1